MSEPETVTLPSAELFGLIGVVPQSFSGVVTATLSRMSHFADIGQRNLTLLTKSLSTDPITRQRELHDKGLLSRRVSLQNIWYDLRSMEDEVLTKWAEAPFTATGEASPQPGPERPTFSGEVLVDRNTGDNPRDRVVGFREDGTLAFIDEAASEAPEGWSRRITVFLRTGEMLRPWRAATPLYHAWFDYLTGGRESVIINDSSMFGNVLSRYRRDHVLTVQVVHSNYLDKMRKDSIHPDRFRTMHRLDWFDLVAALTPGHAEDLVTSGLVHPSRVIAIPNASLPTPVDITEERDPLNGVYAARFAPEKRTSHAIRATQRAHTPEIPVQMDVFGDGPLRSSLHSLTQDIRADDFIHFHGHDPRAREKFKEASFSVLSSLSEGHPLVLLESMAAGCIPIAYDIKYGPSTMIEDGVDGFLVLSGDVHALANRVQQVATMNPDQLHRMRKAAVKKSQMFSPARVVTEWSSELQNALATKRDREQLQDQSLRAELIDARLNSSALLLTIAVTTELLEQRGAEARLSWISRSSEALGGLAVDSSTIDADGRTRMEVTLPLAELDEERRTVCDVYLDVVSPDFAVRTRVTCPSLEEPVRGRTIRLYRTVHGNLSLVLK